MKEIEMDSVFIPEKSYGERFVKTTYQYVVKKIKIDPITEGILLRKKIEDLLWGDDFLELGEDKVREERLKKVDLMIDKYYKRARKFWKIYQQYCYERGSVRATTTMAQRVEDSSEQAKKINKEIKTLIGG
ncbi:MAG: hypothetical protein JSW62_06100 [Thermoplasmatales archaeon]|nr:MAG: hypothetical protein JSW62_06100 [Thermoplasmatales archaeon]